MLEVGHIAKAHGIRGEVIVSMVSNRAELRLAAGSTLYSDGIDFEVVRASAHQGRYIVALAGVTDRSSAEALRGMVLRAPAPDPEPETLWVHELIGAEVTDTEGRCFGPVLAVESNPASDLLVLDGGRLVPLVFVVGHEPGAAVVIDPPAGLLD